MINKKAATKKGKELIVDIIRNRTRKGIFAKQGSSGTRARRYHPRYARKVRKSVRGPVDLELTGQLLSSIRGRARVNKHSVSATAFINGGKAKQKFEWIQEQGMGPQRIKRRFMYITAGEGKRIATAMLKAGSKN